MGVKYGVASNQLQFLTTLTQLFGIEAKDREMVIIIFSKNGEKRRIDLDVHSSLLFSSSQWVFLKSVFYVLLIKRPKMR